MARSVAVNSLLVYLQRFSTAFITLFSTPIILENLGVEDYGIYSLTLGVVAMFNVLNWSLSSSTQRFISVTIGENDKDKLGQVFTNSFYIHLGYGSLLLMLIGSLGMWFTDSVLNIPLEKLEVASKVFILVALISFTEMLMIPFNGLLSAFERFEIISVLGISRSMLKLIAALLLYTSPIQPLLYFSLLMFISALLVMVIMVFYCLSQFNNISLHPRYLDREMVKEQFGFIGWNMIGAVALVGRNQGISVILNVFFGVIANASYGIALQVQSAIGMMSQGLTSALSPRIMKSAGSNNSKQMLYYANATARFGVLTVSILAVPLFINMPYVLDLWLDNVPDGAVVYSQLIIVFIMSTGLSAGMQSVFLAINKVKEYHTQVSIIIILNIPLGALFFFLGAPSYFILVISVLLELCAFWYRLVLQRRYLEVSIVSHLQDLFRMILMPIGLSLLTGYFVLIIGFERLQLMAISTVSSLIVLLFLSFKLSFKKSEKALILTEASLIFKKLTK